ncbi:hypothetical protein [Candidatus Nitrosocosmicus hydrocola]|uniref:hypothetical protein n=1 Tax=Candidatus Nitrosocosmicus hydrocola TaxID=1826872 RepID=UPI0011E58EB7|nr:hypothetical protein [Candidatus Nitrosocosmicus hydrocola]
MTMNDFQNNSKDDQNVIVNAIVGSIKSLKSGKILIEVEKKPTVDIRASKKDEKNKIDIDIIDPDVFGMFNKLEADNDQKRITPEGSNGELNESMDDSVGKIKDKLETAKEFFHLFTDTESSIFDQLKIVKNFAVKLSENNITIVLLRKGKEAIIMGKDASPSISKIISGSDDLQIKSVTESSKLISEIGSTLSNSNGDEDNDNTKTEKKKEDVRN